MATEEYGYRRTIEEAYKTFNQTCVHKIFPANHSNQCCRVFCQVLTGLNALVNDIGSMFLIGFYQKGNHLPCLDNVLNKRGNRNIVLYQNRLPIKKGTTFLISNSVFYHSHVC